MPYVTQATFAYLECIWFHMWPIKAHLCECFAFMNVFVLFTWGEWSSDVFVYQQYLSIWNRKGHNLFGDNLQGSGMAAAP